jgi:Skp family chaperone for outer membrane proteins
MYKGMMIGGGLAVLAATYALGQLLWAQGQPAPGQPAPGQPAPGQPAPGQPAPGQPAPVPATTRIAVVNIEALLQNYKKAQIYKTEADRELQPLRKQAESLRKKIMEQQAELKVSNFDAGKRKQWEQATKKDINKLDEVEREAALRNNRKVEKELVPIYREVLEAVKAHAKSKAIQIVLSYAEDPKIDPFSLASIGRKVNGLESTGCVTPLYVDPAVDITAALADMLNQRYNASPPARK